MTNVEYIEEVIIGYRRQIEKRYQFEYLNKKYELPDSFDRNRVDNFRDYFLNYIYPDINKRNELNAAFESLDNYIKHPEKLLRLVLDSATLMFKFGRSLPKIMTAGIKALKCFRTASRFEQLLADQAIAKNLQLPFETADFNTMLLGLEASDVEDFIQNTASLYATLYDRELIKKIKSVVTQLIKKMKNRPKIYGADEIQGLKIGLDIIQEGDILFDQIALDDQKAILDIAIQIERDALAVVFE